VSPPRRPSNLPWLLAAEVAEASAAAASSAAAREGGGGGDAGGDGCLRGEGYM
jgi:hypothetical protein